MCNNYYEVCADVWSQINSQDLLSFHYFSGGRAYSQLRGHTCSVYGWHACNAAGFNPYGVGRSCHTQVACLQKKDVEHTGSKIQHCGRPQEMYDFRYFHRKKPNVFWVSVTTLFNTIISQPLDLQYFLLWTHNVAPTSFTIKVVHTSFEVLDWM